MNGWYWLLWVAFTVGNIAIWLGTLRHLRNAQALLDRCES